VSENEDLGENEGLYGEVPPVTAEHYVAVTIQVHVDDLPSLYTALGRWAETADNGKGRTRVS
jgi:hypothetical protein